MKKFNIFLLGVVGLMASSCEDSLDPSIPQYNPQGPVVEAGDITTVKTGALASESVLTLENYRQEGAEIAIVKLEKADSLPAGATVSYKLQLSNTEDFARSVTLDAKLGSDETYSVSASEWNDAHVYLFGKSPKEKTAYYRVPVYIDVNGSDYRYDSVDYYAASGTVVETCMDQGFVIEDHYYLMGGMTTWDLSTESLAPYVFEHSADVSVYDDPVFVIKFEVSEELAASNGAYWKIAPQSAAESGKWDNVIGTEVDGDTALSGTLVSTNAQAGKLEVGGKYKMTINMEAMTYNIELLLQPEVLYTPGGANGWNQLNSAWMQLNSEKGYYGVFPVNDAGFKVCTENSWDNAYTYGAKNADPALSGDLLLGQEGKDIKVPAENEGLIWASVQFDPVSYELTTYNLIPISRVGVIGSFAASGWGDDVEMTSADGGVTWSADVTFAAGDEFKVRFNNGWDYNLGGDVKALTLDGSNIKAEEAGDYTVTLTVQPGLPTITLTKK